MTSQPFVGRVRLIVKNKPDTVPLKVDPKNPWDKAVKDLSKEFNANVIAAHTGLTESQVTYRRRVLNCRVMDHRRGLSPESKAILARYDRAIGACRALREHCTEILRHRKRGVRAKAYVK